MVCDNVCDDIIYVTSFMICLSFATVFLVDFCCRYCWSVILLSNLPGNKQMQWILLQINLEK